MGQGLYSPHRRRCHVGTCPGGWTTGLQLTIIKASQSFNGQQWQVYDNHFWVVAAVTGNKAWSKLDVDLYTQFF